MQFFRNRYFKSLGPITCFAGLLLSTHHAHAECDQARKERADFQSSFDNASKAAAAACVSGGALAIFTFGASLVPCAALAATADNQKRIFGEKEMNLQNCEVQALRDAERYRNQELARKARIEAINREFEMKRQGRIEEYQQQIAQVPAEYATQGYDLGQPEVQKEVTEQCEELLKKRDQELSDLESERSRAVAGV